jgi:hypothetical protein
MMSEPGYPLHMEASLDGQLSRWLWLVKWLLVIPHYVVLVFLWLAYGVLSVFAFFAILFTGRYPRSIFEFNVGVLRWSWRVAYYTYAALGTDRYPPFTLAEVPDYPAHLSVDYPERLSRGLVLVKWWLLAIPHYLVVALLLGGGWYAGNATDESPPMTLGLIGVLVLVAAVVLLFTGRYPRPVFDLLLGLNRWVLRVAAYASLMTDEYPPFRLDMGAREGGGGLVVREGPPPAAPPDERVQQPAPSAPGAGGPTGRWTGGRVTALVLGCVVLLFAGGLGTGGVALGVIDQTQRDSEGFLMSDSVSLVNNGFAIASDSVDLSDGGPAGVPGRLLGDARLVVTPSGEDPVFVGLARTSDADVYLSGVQHATVVDFGEGAVPRYRETAGGPPEAPPADAGIWEAAVSGPGTQTLTWHVESGDWTVVVMNENAAAPVAANVAVGGTVPVLGWVVSALLVGAGLLLLLALALIFGSILSVRRAADR